MTIKEQFEQMLDRMSEIDSDWPDPDTKTEITEVYPGVYHVYRDGRLAIMDTKAIEFYSKQLLGGLEPPPSA